MTKKEIISVNQTDLKEFLTLLSAFGKQKDNPFITDAAQTLLDAFFGEESIKSDFENHSKGQIKFK